MHLLSLGVTPGLLVEVMMPKDIGAEVTFYRIASGMLVVVAQREDSNLTRTE
jgi:hypothetical protein